MNSSSDFCSVTGRGNFPISCVLCDQYFSIICKQEDQHLTLKGVLQLRRKCKKSFMKGGFVFLQQQSTVYFLPQVIIIYLNTDLPIMFVVLFKQNCFPASNVELKTNGVITLLHPNSLFFEMLLFDASFNLLFGLIEDCCVSCFLFKYCFMSAVEGSNGNGLRKDDIIFGSGRWKEETEKLYHTFDWVRIFEAQQISETF